MKTRKWFSTISFLFFISSFALLNTTCSDKTDDEPTERLLYTDDFCVINDIFAQDDETVLLVDNCGNLMKIDISSRKATKVVERMFYQEGFFSSLVPGSFFYLTLTETDGEYAEPFLLNKVDLATGTIQTVISEGLHNPNDGGYITGNKKMAIQSPSSEEVMILDLENLSSEFYTISGTLIAFSPDDKQAVITTIGGTTYIYDFGCDCEKAPSLPFTNNCFWRPKEIFSIYITNITGIYRNTLVIKDLISTAAIGSIDNVINWNVPPQGSLVVAFVADEDYETSFMAHIETFDHVTQMNKTLYPVKFNPITSTGIEKFTPTPGDDKLLFVNNSNELRVIKLE